jgi:hypothetical protein
MVDVMEHPTLTELADLVHTYFEQNGIEVSYDPEQGTGEAEGAVFSVHNVAANLARIERDQWPDYVAWHFGHLADGPPQIPSEYAQASKRLRVRLASTAWVNQLPWKENNRPVAEDLHEVLMITIDQGASNVPPDNLEEWNQDPDTIWDEARRNTMWDEPRERRLLLKPTGERFTWVRGSWWVSTLLLDLGRYLSPRHNYGAVAMAPVRDALFFHQITDRSFVNSMMAMIDFGLSIHFEGPDPVSPHVYWWHDGMIRRLVAFENGQTRPEWDDRFREVLADLETGLDPAVMN